MRERSGKRGPLDPRPIKITPGAVPYAEGSALIEVGNTRVLCAATVDDRAQVPRREEQRLGDGRSSMLPRSTLTRTQRDRGAGGVKGRTQEIQRLIGRALRAAVSLETLGPRQITVNCDVLQADGGTRTASITGGYVALALALKWMHKKGIIASPPSTLQVAAISVGLIDGEVFVDLDYPEDSTAEVDLNVVMTANGELVEVQGTGERAGFPRETLTRMLDASGPAIDALFAAQRHAVGAAANPIIG